jgi:acetyl-CoA carboxylase alpha subunit
VAKKTFLDFEQPIADLENKIEEVSWPRKVSSSPKISTVI